MKREPHPEQAVLRIAMLQDLQDYGSPCSGPRDLQLALALAAMGVPVDVYVCGLGATKGSGGACSQGVRVFGVPRPPWSGSDRSRETGAVFANLMPQLRAAGPYGLIYASRSVGGDLTSKVKGALGLPLMVDCGSPPCRLSSASAARKAEAVLVESLVGRRRLIQKGWPEQAVHVVPRGVDAQSFRSVGRDRARGLLGLERDSFVVVSDTETGYAMARQLASSEGDNCIRFVLLAEQSSVCGAPSGMAARIAPVPFPSGQGRAQTLRACYSAADAVLVDARGGAGVIEPLEALACGAPMVILNAREGDDEIVHEGVNGHLIKHGDWAAAADCLQCMHAQPARARAMGRAAILQVRTFHTWGRVADRVLSIYSGLAPAIPAVRRAPALKLVSSQSGAAHAQQPHFV